MVAFTHGRGAFLKTEASQVDLSIQLEASSRTAFVDEVVNWQLRATNNGPGDTREIEVELQLHFGHALEQLPDQCVSEKEQITCHLGKLVSGQTVYLDVTTRSAQMDLLTAAASITGPAPDPVSNNDFDSLKIQVVLPRFEWFIPFFHSSPELESGIAVANLSDSDSHLLLRAFLEEGVPPCHSTPAVTCCEDTVSPLFCPGRFSGSGRILLLVGCGFGRIESSSPASFKSSDAVPWMEVLPLLSSFSRPSSRESSRVRGPIECSPPQPISVWQTRIRSR